jgi:hypothetical protein
MPFNVNQFRNAMRRDGARPNLFDVTIATETLRGVRSEGMADFQFFCKSAQLPGSTIGVVNVPYFGRELKFAGNRTFADWTVTIINDEQFFIRNFFERWLNAINSHAGNRRDLLTPQSYVCDALVQQYGKDESIPAAYQFVGMFPTDISAIDLDWGSNDAIEEFTVNFTYQYWVNKNTTDSGQSASNRIPTGDANAALGLRTNGR